MRISDWSSDVCSSDLHPHRPTVRDGSGARSPDHRAAMGPRLPGGRDHADDGDARRAESPLFRSDTARSTDTCHSVRFRGALPRSEEHTSEPQSLMRISYAVFCLKKKITD